MICNTNSTLNLNSYSGKSNNTEEKIQKIIAEIAKRGIDVTGEYKQWIGIGAALAKEFGDRGRTYFHEVSRHCQSYSKQETDLQYDHCQYNMGKYHIGTFFHIAKKHGISY